MLDRVCTRTWTPRQALVLGVLGCLVVSIADYFTGSDLSVGVLYIAPVSFLTWHRSGKAGALASVFAVASWFYCLHRQMPWELHQHPLVILWHFVTGLLVLWAHVFLAGRLKHALRTQQALASTDALTGSLNVRAFREAAHGALDRMRAHSNGATFLYIDVDHFKRVNDRYGHAEGDRLLVAIADAVRRVFRRDDIFGRLGGDEFGLILPGTGPAEARVVADRLQRELITTTNRTGWPVSFSIGMITCNHPPRDLDEMLQETDRLMLQVKERGRDGILHQVLPGPFDVDLGPAAATGLRGEVDHTIDDGVEACSTPNTTAPARPRSDEDPPPSDPLAAPELTACRLIPPVTTLDGER